MNPNNGQVATVIPIGGAERQRVGVATDAWIGRAIQTFGRPFSKLPIAFDLTGRAFGMYRVDRRGPMIRYNPYLFAKYFAEGLAITVPHEVAHYVTDMLYGCANVRAHGPEWRSVMARLGAQRRPEKRLDLTGIPVRRHRRFAYQCGCRMHQLTTRSHDRVERGTAVYQCRICSMQLIPVA
jgi:SprT protein